MELFFFSCKMNNVIDFFKPPIKLHFRWHLGFTIFRTFYYPGISRKKNFPGLQNVPRRWQNDTQFLEFRLKNLLKTKKGLHLQLVSNFFIFFPKKRSSPAIQTFCSIPCVAIDRHIKHHCF